MLTYGKFFTAELSVSGDTVIKVWETEVDRDKYVVGFNKAQIIESEEGKEGEVQYNPSLPDMLAKGFPPLKFPPDWEHDIVLVPDNADPKIGYKGHLGIAKVW